MWDEDEQDLDAVEDARLSEIDRKFFGPRTTPKGGRPRKKVRPEIRLSTAYVSKIGSECLEMFEVVDAAAGRAVDVSTRRDLAVVAERLKRMGDLFV